VKRRDLIKKVEDLGCVFIRYGGKHDWYQNLAADPSLACNGLSRGFEKS
jgi:hypothetical protein